MTLSPLQASCYESAFKMHAGCADECAVSIRIDSNGNDSLRSLVTLAHTNGGETDGYVFTANDLSMTPALDPVVLEGVKRGAKQLRRLLHPSPEG